MLPEYINPYYLHPKGCENGRQSFILVPTPKDYGEYLQNKRKRKKK